jgi:hypothetical protein
MNPILSALQAGYSPQRILNYIKKIDPDLAMKINTALQAGHSIDNVLNYFSKMGNQISSFLGKPEKSKSNIYQAAQQSIHPFISGAAQGAGILGAGALGAYALGRAVPQIAQGELLPALQQSSSPLQIGMQEKAEQIPFIETEAQTIKPPEAPIQPQAAVQAETQIPKEPIQVTPLPEVLRKQTEALVQAGNSLENVEYALKSTQPKVVKEYEKATKAPIRSAIEEFSKTLSQKEEKQNITQPEIKLEQPKVEERKTVALPNGDIGEIVNIRQGIATVNANGKEYRRKVEDLIESPIPEKDLAELHDELMKGIESKTGQEISRMVNWAGYDPKTNELAFIPHIGALYVYDNISPEDAKELTNLLTQRKTTGENYLGAWIKGSQSPIGSAMSKLIQKLQKERGGKGQEYKGKYEKIYDAIEPAKLASKEKYEEKKRENQDRKKRKAKKPRLD